MRINVFKLVKCVRFLNGNNIFFNGKLADKYSLCKTTYITYIQWKNS